MLFGSGLEVGPDEAVSVMNAGAQVVDVREPNEFASGAILGAVNVPLGKSNSMALRPCEMPVLMTLHPRS